MITINKNNLTPHAMDILKELFDEIMKTTSVPSSYAKSTSFNDEIDKLLSGEGYIEAIQNPLNDKTQINLGCQLCGLAPLAFVNASDKELESLTPEVRERIKTYLTTLLGHYNTIVDKTVARVINTVPKQKTLDEMSREELLDYIKQKFNK